MAPGIYSYTHYRTKVLELHIITYPPNHSTRHHPKDPRMQLASWLLLVLLEALRPWVQGHSLRNHYLSAIIDGAQPADLRGFIKV